MPARPVTRSICKFNGATACGACTLHANDQISLIVRRGHAAVRRSRWSGGLSCRDGWCLASRYRAAQCSQQCGCAPAQCSQQCGCAPAQCSQQCGCAPAQCSQQCGCAPAQCSQQCGCASAQCSQQCGCAPAQCSQQCGCASAQCSQQCGCAPAQCSQLCGCAPAGSWRASSCDVVADLWVAVSPSCPSDTVSSTGPITATVARQNGGVRQRSPPVTGMNGV